MVHGERCWPRNLTTKLGLSGSRGQGAVIMGNTAGVDLDEAASPNLIMIGETGHGNLEEVGNHVLRRR